MTEKEKARRNAHLSPTGYVVIALILMFIALCVAKYIPLGIIPAMMIFFWVFTKIPLLTTMWEKAEEQDPTRKDDRIF